MDKTKNNLKFNRIPQIKQTKTSQLRFKNANPIYDLERTYSHLLNKTNAADVVKLNKTVAEESKPKRNFIKENAAAAAKFRKIPNHNAAKKKKDSNFPKQSLPSQTRRSMSCENIPIRNNISKITTPILNDVKNITNETVIFKTPSAYNRRSIRISTPKTNLTARKSTHPLLKTTPSESELQERLNKWLKVHGKPMGSYHHLKCFGLHVNNMKSIDEENKENIEVEECLNSSYEDLAIKVQEENAQPKGDIPFVLKDVLEDLHSVILDGYPREHCEMWLQMIKENFSNIEEEVLYWECRAALEEARGGIGEAIECYKSAIIQGAQLKDIDENLDNLLKKFSLMELSTSKYSPSSNQNVGKSRDKIIAEARNAFKSSIIKFAIQEKKFKNNKNKLDVETDKTLLYATPVRRSTRKSRTSYVHTPGMKLCSSLKTETYDETIVFTHNPALR